MPEPRLEFQPLSRDRAAFSCGVPALDDYLKRQASQDGRRNIARVFIAVPPGTNTIAGYYTLSSLSISLDEIPEVLARRLPKYGELPAALVGRLARDLRYRGQGVGEILLADAIRRVAGASSEIAIYAVVADAQDDAAAAFYESFGFRSQASRPHRLFLPTATALDGLDEESRQRPA